ncbi:amidohydrolase family protein [Actinophytocola sp.]|uniref:amidohydrolase family protein n=1 Tax=Actinophytocola sp. TaxID=1872138 RepID=UPI003D6AA5B6
MIDAHHHLWDPARRDYPWLAGLDPIRRPYTVDDLRRVSAADATVLVQTVSSARETQELVDTAAASGGLIAGVVGWADLAAPDIADRLAAPRHRELLVGLRHQVENEPDAGWLLRPDVLRGLSAVTGAGLAYDLLVNPAQYASAAELADRLPDARLVLDHAGKPPIATGELDDWAGAITEIARRPNVFCKLSGFVTEADRTWWRVRDLAPYADHVLAVFGPERVMFGSDWPVCELAATYGEVVDAARTLTRRAVGTRAARDLRGHRAPGVPPAARLAPTRPGARQSDHRSAG